MDTDAVTDRIVSNVMSATGAQLLLKADSSASGGGGTNASSLAAATSDERCSGLFSKAAFDVMAKMATSGSKLSSEQASILCGAMETLRAAGIEQEGLIDFDGPILSDQHFAFNWTPPVAGSTLLSLQYICEFASRLLFLSVHWAQSIPAFQHLTLEVQTTLIRSCWCQLFVLGLAQTSQVMSLGTILAAIITHLQTIFQQETFSITRIKQVTEHICKLQDFVENFQKLSVDEREYAYLKAIILFSPEAVGSRMNNRQIESFQEMSATELRNHVSANSPETKSPPDSLDRYSKLLLRLIPLRSLMPNLTEELFFSGLIGNVQIDSIIPYILKMDANEFANQFSATTSASTSSVSATTSTTAAVSIATVASSGGGASRGTPTPTERSKSATTSDQESPSKT